LDKTKFFVYLPTRSAFSEPGNNIAAFPCGAKRPRSGQGPSPQRLVQVPPQRAPGAHLDPTTLRMVLWGRRADELYVGAHRVEDEASYRHLPGQPLL